MFPCNVKQMSVRCTYKGLLHSFLDTHQTKIYWKTSITTKQQNNRNVYYQDCGMPSLSDGNSESRGSRYQSLPATISLHWISHSHLSFLSSSLWSHNSLPHRTILDRQHRGFPQKDNDNWGRSPRMWMFPNIQ